MTTKIMTIRLSSALATTTVQSVSPGAHQSYCQEGVEKMTQSQALGQTQRY